MTFAALLAYDDETLDLLIEAHIYGRHWQVYSQGTVGILYVLPQAETVTYRPWSAFAHTQSWDRTMTLWYCHGHEVDLVRMPENEIWVRILVSGPIQRCLSEEETRRAICRAVLWTVMERQCEQGATHV
jgi:hypothetical protein